MHIVVFKSIWSPYLSIIEMRKNKKDFTETKYDMFERIMTYEDELYSQPRNFQIPLNQPIVPIRSSKIQDKLRTSCEQIALVILILFNP